MKLQTRPRLTPDRFLEVGVVQGPHGLKGALTIFSYTRPAKAVAGYSFWWLGASSESLVLYPVRRCWQHGKRILAQLEGVDDCQQADQLKRMKIWVPIEDVDVGEDEFLWDDLIGCEVRLAEHGNLLGTVTGLEEYGAQDIMTVTSTDSEQPGEWMLPFIKDVVLDVDLAGKCITVALPDGMDACFTPRF